MVLLHPGLRRVIIYLAHLEYRVTITLHHGWPLMGGMRFDRIGGQAFRDSKADIC